MRRGLVLAAVVALAAAAVVVIVPGGPQAPRASVRVHRDVTATEVAARTRGLSCRPRRRTFRTLPDLRPTPFCVAVRRGASLAADDILVTPRPDPRREPNEQFGLMLVSRDGKLLWYAKRPAKVHDLKVASYRGKPVLAYFQRTGGGYYELLDEHYEPVARIRAKPGPTDEHELRVMPDGTAWVGSDPTVRGGKLYDYVVQHVDVATGKVLWQWRALDHVSLRESFEARPRGVPWDYFHGNAIDPPTASDPTMMVSARNTSSVYGIDPKTGLIGWILGGKRDQFHLARHPRWVFCTQHDAQRLPGARLLLFDNGGTHIARDPRCPVHPARALLFKLDVRHRRVRLLRSFSSVGLARSGGGFFSGWVGSAAPLSGGRMLVDWGQIPRVSELGANGRENLALRLRFWSYRAAPARWAGRPADPPAIVARRANGRVTIWASWNGATSVRHWQVLAGASPRALAPVGGPAAFQDLETRIAVHTSEPYVAVRALDARGAALATSPVAHVG